MQLNDKPNIPKTNEGAPSRFIDNYSQLRRSVLACLLWEKSFYENGTEIYERIKLYTHLCTPQQVSELAIECRTKHHIRHVSLLLARELARHENARGSLIGRTINKIILRADDLTEFLALYWKDRKEPLSNQVKKGLAFAFRKFDEYQLAKYDRPKKIKLRDVLFLCHAKPQDKEQERLWKKLIDKKLKTPDTWEVSLCAGQNKKETFERLLKNNKLGYLAFLRNLKNMIASGVSQTLIESYAILRKPKKILPFQFLSAAKACPHLEHLLDILMIQAANQYEKLHGKTILLIDISGSMDGRLSSKSTLRYNEAACALAILLREMSNDVNIYSFSNNLVFIAPRHGMALKDAILHSQHHGATYLGNAIQKVSLEHPDYKRLIVITDEQSHDQIPKIPIDKMHYMINISSCKNGVGYGGKWIHIDGFSEHIMTYICEVEKELRFKISD